MTVLARVGGGFLTDQYRLGNRLKVDRPDTFLAAYRGDLFGWSAADASAIDTPARTAAAQLGQGAMQSTGTINNSISYLTQPLATGTYTLTMIHVTSTDRGIYTVTIDGGPSLGTIDGYSAGATLNVVTEIAGIALAAGVHTVKFTMATKAAASTAYRYTIQTVTLTRTGP